MRGVVLFWFTHSDRPGGFGFIAPENAPNNRDANVWFGPKALNGLTVKAGDRVGFDISPFYKIGKGPQAARVWLDDDREQILTLEGIDDVT